MATSVPPIQFESAGVVLPTEAAILAGVQTDMDSAFGGGLNPALNTPQGQIATSTTAIVAEKNSEIAYIVNQFDPQYASGRFQDGLARMYFLTRKPATATVVTCTLGGLSGTVVPAGTFAQDTSGNTYTLLSTVTIGSGGSVSSTWQNNATGPIPCPSNTLTQVYQAINGWDTITNPVAGVLGSNVESQQDFYFRIQNSVALNGRGTCPSIYAVVFQQGNVLDCFVIDNPSGLTVNYGATNYPLAPHSVFVAVVGGDSQDIAQAIWGKKDTGCNYAAYPAGGSPVPGDGTVVTETVQDTSGYSYPQPAYQVSFLRPGALPILFAVQIANTPSLPSNIATLVQNAIIAQFNGVNGNARARIGSTVIAAQFYAAVAAIGNNVVLLSIQVGTSVANLNEVAVGIDQTPTIDASNISVALV
jgi:uncharacterized phage protein gp47/JayE